MTNINLTSLNNKPINQLSTITQVRSKPKERKSTSLKIDPSLYTEFAIEARRQQIDIQEFLDYAMRLAIKESKRRK